MSVIEHIFIISDDLFFCITFDSLAPSHRVPHGNGTLIEDVKVANPQKIGDGMNAHVVYTIEAKRLLDSGTTRHHVVSRRYSDFSWLRNQLVNSYVGCIVAPLPEKTVLGIGRFTPEFLERRRRGLDIFMRRVCAHHVLRSSPDVDMFVSATESELDSYRNNNKKTPRSPGPGATGSGLMGYLSHLTQTVQNTWSGTPTSRSDDDAKCDAINEYASSLAKSLGACRNNTSAAVRGDKDLAQAWFQFGLSFTLHGQFEAQTETHGDDSTDSLSRALTHLGQCADRVSVLLSDKAERSTNEFLDPINDYCRLVEAVQEMMKGRQSTLAGCRESEEKVVQLKGKLESARSKGRVNKVPDLEAQLRRVCPI